MKSIRITCNRSRIKISSHIKQTIQNPKILIKCFIINYLFRIRILLLMSPFRTGSGYYPLKLRSGDRKKHDYFLSLLSLLTEICQAHPASDTNATERPGQKVLDLTDPDLKGSGSTPQHSNIAYSTVPEMGPRMR
jgi:hypothetical protein